MKGIYMDMCSLKRPFDNQSQGRIWIEAEAVIRILDAFYYGEIQICNSELLEFENENNPNLVRKERVRTLLNTFGKPIKASTGIYETAEKIQRENITAIDSLHLAFAENIGTGYFVTCDDEILRKAKILKLKTKIVDPVSIIKELNL
jgi:hypothetical protein